MWEQVKTWANEPFKTDMDVLHWFMFLGMIIFLMVMWRFVIAHLKGVVS